MQDELHTAIPTLQIHKIFAIRVPHVSAEERSATITVACYETRTRRLQVHINAIPDGRADMSVAGLDTLHTLDKSGYHLSLKGEENLVSDAALFDGSAVECGFEKTNLQASPESAPTRTIETFERSWPGIDSDNLLREPRRDNRHCPEGRGVTERREIVMPPTQPEPAEAQGGADGGEKCRFIVLPSVLYVCVCVCKACKFHSLLPFHLKSREKGCCMYNVCNLNVIDLPPARSRRAFPARSWRTGGQLSHGSHTRRLDNTAG